MYNLLIHTLGRFLAWSLYRLELRPDGEGNATLHIEKRWKWAPDLDLSGGHDDGDLRWIVGQGR